jgi:hypothetical protein
MATKTVAYRKGKMDKISRKLLENKAKVLNDLIQPVKNKSGDIVIPIIDAYRPGKYKLYNLSFETVIAHRQLFSLPKGQRLTGDKIYWYIEGLMDCLDLIKKEIFKV